MENPKLTVLLIAILLAIVLASFQLYYEVARKQIISFSQYCKLKEEWLQQSYKSTLHNKPFMYYCLIFYEMYLEDADQNNKVDRIRQWRFSNSHLLYDIDKMEEVSRVISKL